MRLDKTLRMGRMDGMTATIALLMRRCRKCKHQWLKRREQDPKVCPKCKRTDWNGK